MSFLWAIIAGLIIGAIARAILPGRQNIPIWLTIVLGVIGAILGNVIASVLGVRDTGGFDWIRHIAQIDEDVVTGVERRRHLRVQWRRVRDEGPDLPGSGLGVGPGCAGG